MLANRSTGHSGPSPAPAPASGTPDTARSLAWRPLHCTRYNVLLAPSIVSEHFDVVSTIVSRIEVWQPFLVRADFGLRRDPGFLGALEIRLGALETGNACDTFDHRPACRHEGARGVFSAACRRPRGDRGLSWPPDRHCLPARLDDRALEDIRLLRFQIEAAVYGLMPLSGQTDEGPLAFAAEVSPRGARRANAGGGAMELTVATILVTFAGVS